MWKYKLTGTRVRWDSILDRCRSLELWAYKLFCWDEEIIIVDLNINFYFLYFKINRIIIKVPPMVRGIFLLFVKYWDYPRSSGELKSLHTLPWYETSPSIRGTCYSGQECWVIPEGYSRLNGYVSVPVKHVASPYIWGYFCKFRNIRIIPDPPGTYSVDRKSTLSQDHPR